MLHFIRVISPVTLQGNFCDTMKQLTHFQTLINMALSIVASSLPSMVFMPLHMTPH